ncbi:MAG: hypothetical protein WDO72_19890 [Pseudomonadota bacterium]
MLPVAFDPHWRIAPGAWLRTSTLRSLSATLQAAESRGRRRREEDAQRYGVAVECLLANVAAAHLVAPGHALAVRRHRHREVVDPVVYGAHLAACLDAAERCGLLTPNTHGIYSTVTPTAKLLNMLPRPLPLSVLYQVEHQACLELRGEKNEHGQPTVLPFTATAVTETMTREMVELNAWWRSLRVRLAGTHAWLVPSPSGMLLRIATMQHTHCLRIFNGGTFDQGGRLYRAWWVNMEKAQRRANVLLAGEPVAEVDFTAQYLRLAYRHVGAAWTFAANVDPYLPDGCPEEHRDGYKKCTLSLLSGARGLHLPNDVQDSCLFPPGTKAATVYASIRARHPALQAAGAFGSTLGNELARVDSDLMVKLLLRLKAAGVPALGIHDAVLVPRSRVDQVARVMVETARDMLGMELPVSVRTESVNELAPTGTV